MPQTEWEMEEQWDGPAPILAIVVPCYNEEEVLPTTSRVLAKVLDDLTAVRLVDPSSFVLFVDDGSKDRTWEIIEEQHAADARLCGLKLARNAGHQNALLAGLMMAKDRSDCLVSIDADLQDDVRAIGQFVRKFREGCDIVYGVREDRTTDSWFKRTTAEQFYKLLSRLGVDIVYNHADYRLMSRRAVEHLAEFTEVNLFLRGIVPLIGFPSDKVYYARRERVAGESKYPLRRMIAFAIDGITSFSIRPIRMVTVTGFLFFLLSLIVAGYALFQKLSGQPAPGWTSLVMSVWFIGGIQIMCAGLIGEYIGKIYKEVKRRPKYIIEQSLGHFPGRSTGLPHWRDAERERDAGQEPARGGYVQASEPERQKERNGRKDKNRHLTGKS